jgi:hypothetical protein
MMTFHLDSDTGRIGRLWWTNSQLVPISSEELGLEALSALSPRWVLWGRCGWGQGAGWALASVRGEP